jgi:hypothetical protein
MSNDQCPRSKEIPSSKSQSEGWAGSLCLRTGREGADLGQSKVLKAGKARGYARPTGANPGKSKLIRVGKGERAEPNDLKFHV